jgi:hypothetical protein
LLIEIKNVKEQRDVNNAKLTLQLLDKFRIIVEDIGADKVRFADRAIEE